MKLLRGLKPTLTLNQVNRLSNIFDNAGQVVLAVVVLSPLITAIDQTNRYVVLSGTVVVIFCWIISVWTAKRSEP